METLGGVRSEDDTRVYLRKNLEHWDRYGYGLWVLRDGKDGSFVGRRIMQHLFCNFRNPLAGKLLGFVLHVEICSAGDPLLGDFHDDRCAHETQ